MRRQPPDLGTHRERFLERPPSQRHIPHRSLSHRRPVVREAHGSRGRCSNPLRADGKAAREREVPKEGGGLLVAHVGSPFSKSAVVAPARARGKVGMEETRRRVYGWAGAAYTSPVGPVSTIWPAFMTATRSQTCFTTERSWETKMSVR